MTEVSEALSMVLAKARPKSAVGTPVPEALGLVLAEDIASDIDSPPHDKSLVDGYAIVAADAGTLPCELDVLEEVTAGAIPTKDVAQGTATRIMTGAPIPAGADAVVMVEQTELRESARGERVRIGSTAGSAPICRGQNIMRRATSLAQGQVVLRSGHPIRSIEIGLLSEVGRHEVSVIGRPSLSVIATGSELVPADRLPNVGQIRNSNGPMLSALARRAGAGVTDLGIARDDRSHLRQLIQQGLEHDVLVLSGGVSAGVLDLVPGVL